MFKKDMKIMEELAEIHKFHRMHIWNLGRNIARCLNEYQSDTGCSDIQQFNKEIAELKRRSDELYDRNDPLTDLSNLVNNVMSILDNNDSFNYKIRKDIIDYTTLCEDYFDALNESVNYNYSNKNVSYHMVYSYYFDKDMMMLSEINCGGEYDIELEVKFNLIKNNYSERWGL